jgi:Putative amidoligase enzyme
MLEQVVVSNTLVLFPLSHTLLLNNCELMVQRGLTNSYLTGAVEFTTPILKYDSSQSWVRDIHGLWTFLDTHMLIETHDKCGTHIHMSLPDGMWPLQHLKKICRSVLWFETAFEILVPESRRGNPYCKSNRLDNPKFLSKSLNQCLEMVDECQSNQGLADLMNNQGDRYYAWNFINLYYGGKKTIEIRRGHGVEDHALCVSWVELAVSFVQAAIKSGSLGGLQLYAENKSVEDLLRFIQSATVPGLKRPQALQTIFSGKSGAILPKQVGNLNAEERAELQKKMAQDGKKNLMLKKFKATQQ